ncbi:PREDICTED: 5-oxoprolinase, partial [Condylura cristata]|uniref:5-oxoprolinase n=1 Tax=Condylura cristata TaxID=143302 RepID=UPI000643185C
MRSDGGLAPMDSFTGSRAVLSGPAGGVVGYAATTYRAEGGQPVIGFDMGGTSTDVSRYAGEFEHVFEASTAGITLQAPQLDINTVAAGGGSRLFFRSGLFVVGPESAGAHPGPACYRKGGPVTVTDANLVLGRLLPASFPCIFGPGEDQPLSPEASRQALEAVATEVNGFLTNGPCPGSPLSLEEVAMGFVRVANEAMCRPIRALTQARGHDPSAHVLACFGGAGGQHVFWPGQSRPVFYVASRGHHADIGGSTPGSMPPHSSTLQQEGAVFLSFRLVQGGVFQEEEQMGRILQRTAISTNIKERLDFSCALFGPDGGLVSNAPHIPVHLGAMQETVQFQ